MSSFAKRTATAARWWRSFSFRSTANLTKRQIEQEIVRKARHIFRKVGDTLSGG